MAEVSAEVRRWGQHMITLATRPQFVAFGDLPVHHTQAHLEKLEREGKFPLRIQTGGKPVWNRAEVAAWAEAYGKSRKPKRDAPSGRADDLD